MAAAWVGAAIVVVVGCIAWWGVWWGPFVFDDEAAIIQNLPLLAGDPWRAAFGSANPLANRPLACLSLVTDFAVFGQGPFGPHLINFLLHLANGALLFATLRRALLAPNLGGRFDESRAVWMATAIAMMWVAHPLAGDAVAYATQRSTLLASGCFLLALYAVSRAHASPRPTSWRSVAVVALVGALASKEDMVTAPLLVVLFERAFMLPSWSLLRGRAGWHAALASSWLVLVACLLLGPHNPTVGYATRHPVTAWQWLMTQAGAVVHYLWLAIWPAGVRTAYDWDVVTEFAQAVVPGLAVLALLAATVWCWRQRPWWGWLGALYFLLLAPTSTVMPIVTEIAAERRVYLAMLLPLVAVVAGIDRLAARVGRSSRWIATLCVGIAVVALVAAARERVAVYGSKAAFWADAFQKHTPGGKSFLSGIVLTNYAVSLWENGRIDEAHVLFDEAIQCDGPTATTWSLYAQSILHRGRHEEAVGMLRQLVQTDAGVDTFGALGKALVVWHAAARAPDTDPRLDEAEPWLRRSLALRPNDLASLGALAYLLATKGRIQEAIDVHTQLNVLVPTAVEPFMDRARLLERIGRGSEARVLLEGLLGRRPNDVVLHIHLAGLCSRLGDAPRAIVLLQQALQIEPGNAEVQSLLRQLQSGR